MHTGSSQHEQTRENTPREVVGMPELCHQLETVARQLLVLRAQLGGDPPLDSVTHTPTDRMLLTVQDLARRTGFSVHTIRDWCEQDLLPAQKIGNRWRLEPEAAMMALKNLNRRRRRRRNGRNES